MSEYRERYEKWLSSPFTDEGTKAELRALSGNEDEIKMRFMDNLRFGTGGLRGIMAAGSNCMNVYTVAYATQGLADLINQKKAAARGVAIAYDSRNNSEKFSRVAAEVLAANGVKVYIFDGIRPTPELSFALRHLGCVAGVNVTASHNPKQYNGYKAYWDDGAQLSPEHADAVCDYISTLDIFTDVKRTDFDGAVSSGMIKIIGKEVDEAYLSAVLAEAVDPEVAKKASASLNIVYTPLHGAGYKLVPEVLSRLGLKNIYTVPEQMVISGDFPTVEKPNPELENVFPLGIALAEKVHSDLVIATDPDSDRVGVMSRDKNGVFRRITGNQMGALLLDYIISAYKRRGTLPGDAYAVKTIVSTELFAQICRKNGVRLYNVLTGFKFIGEVIKNCEAEGRGTYIFGFEESYGYLKGTYARDKDAVCGAMLIGEMTAYYKLKGMTLCDALDDLFARYGFYMEGCRDVYMEGLGGMARRARITENLRKNPPAEFAGKKIISIGDYEKGTITDTVTGKSEPTNLPCSDVLRYELENGDIAVIRPSGTEPKIKMYFLAHAEDRKGLEETVKGYIASSDTLLCD